MNELYVKLAVELLTDSAKTEGQLQAVERLHDTIVGQQRRIKELEQEKADLMEYKGRYLNITGGE